MNEIHTRINKVIARILAGESQVDDILILHQWLNEKKENELEFLQLKSFWETEVETTFTGYPEQVYEKYIQPVFNKKTNSPDKKPGNIGVLSIAASITILLGIFISHFLTGNQQPVECYTYLGTDDITSFYLPDSTYVKLNKDSKLTYTGDYDTNERTIRLDGEAYFDVRKNPSKVFKVGMGSSAIEVLGTKFNVQAYAGSSHIIATLEEGKIRFRSGDKQITLDPDQQLIYDKETGQADVQIVNTALYLAWKDRIYRYHSITMTALCKELARRFGVEIQLPERLKTVSVSGSFLYNQSIDEVLAIMQQSVHFKWKRKANKIIIQ